MEHLGNLQFNKTKESIFSLLSLNVALLLCQ